MYKCWDIKGCPASHYLNCEAYNTQTSCWDLKKGCLCQVFFLCTECPIYQKRPYFEAPEDLKEPESKNS